MTNFSTPTVHSGQMDSAQLNKTCYKQPFSCTELARNLAPRRHHFNNFTFDFTTDPPPKLEAVGCYKDKINDRSMPTIYANFRPYINWNNLNATLQQCAFVARDIGYEYFGLQHYGECWSSENAALTYAKHGLQMDARQCWSNVGGVNTNFVYRIV